MSSSGALFGSTTGAGSGAGGRGGAGGKNLIEFRAGKMTMKGKMVHPDKRKGLLYIHQTDDALMHFCWKERSKPNAEDDLIIFPDDVEYKVVPQCTTGRVYVLKFKSTNRKMFFWMQDPKTDKDEENCRKLNDYLNNPPTPGSSRGGGGALSGLPAELAGIGGESDLQSLLGSMNQQQLMQLLGGMGGMGGLSSLMGGRSSTRSSDSNPPSRISSSPGARTTSAIDSTTSLPTPRPFTASGAIPTASSSVSANHGAADDSGHAADASHETGASTTQRIQLSDLQNILSGFGAMETDAPKGVDLTDSLTAELLIPILANPEVQERLVPFLPEGGENLPKSEEELRQTAHSPQFKQALAVFSAAFSSCQLGPLMAQFGLGDDAVTAATVGDFAAFARALQESDAAKKKAAARAAAATASSEAGRESASTAGTAGKDEEPPTDMEQD